jgi:hypothetical protein
LKTPTTNVSVELVEALVLFPDDENGDEQDVVKT